MRYFVPDMSDDELSLLEAECLSIAGERGGRIRAALFELRRRRAAGHSPGHNSPAPSASDPADANSSSCAKGDSNPHGVTH